MTRTREERARRAAELRPLLRERLGEDEDSKRRIAEQIGRSHTWLNKFLDPETPSIPTESTLRLIERWADHQNGSSGHEVITDPEAPEAGWAGRKTADAIMDVLGRTPDGVRRQQGVVSLEAAAEIGYKLALRIALPPDEMEKIMAWRRALLDAAESG